MDSPEYRQKKEAEAKAADLARLQAQAEEQARDIAPASPEKKAEYLRQVKGAMPRRTVGEGEIQRRKQEQKLKLLKNKT
jgi:hypothetical protein